MKILLDNLLMDDHLPDLPRRIRTGCAEPMVVSFALVGFKPDQVQAKITNADGTTLALALINAEGNKWGCMIPASHFTSYGTMANGVRVEAKRDGEDWREVYHADLRIEASTPGAPAGTGITADMKHEEFAALDPDEATIADIIRLLKGDAE